VRSVRHRTVVLLLLSVLAPACGHGNPARADAAPAGEGAEPADAGSDADDESEPALSPSSSWAELLRGEKWADGARAIDALPADQKQKPEVRFARAAAAIAVGDGKTAVAQLADLEAALPALAGEVSRARANAQSIAGPFLDAGEWFEKHAATSEDELAAARAFEKAGQRARARAACGRVLGAEHHSRAQEAEARAIRMRADMAPRGDGPVVGGADEAAGDARWLLVHAADAFAKDAESMLSRADPKHPLRAREWLARGEAFADAGELDEALRAFDRILAAPSQGVGPCDVKRAKAEAMMRTRQRYLDASALFRQCASASPNPHAASDLLGSARALSRADQDDEAIARYGEVEKRFPKATEAASAAFYAARLEVLHGRWEKAASAFDDYAKRYPSGADRDEAAHLRAIAHFEVGDTKLARTLLEQRAGSERDDDARARMTNLAALAALRDGDRTHAIARFTAVASTEPLSWAALVARARLAQLGAPLPPTIPPPAGASSEPLAVALPEAVEILHRIGLDDAAEAALRARESAITAQSPARNVEALCTAYGKIGRAKRRVQISTQVSRSELANAPGASTRWAWQCAYPEPFGAAVRDVEVRETLPEDLLYAVMHQESAFDADVVSPARAVGLMQLMPQTASSVAKEIGLRFDEADLHSAGRSLVLGGRHVHDLLVASRGSLPIAVASYNAGAESVLRWVQRMKGMEIDAFVEAIPFAETRAYVVRVMGNYARYGFLDRGEAGVPKLDLALPVP